MRWRKTLALLLAMTGAAAAQDTPRTLYGTWEMSNAERDRACTLTLKNTPSGPGLAIEWEKRCPEVFPFSREVVAWKLGAREAIALVNARGQIVLELSELEDGFFEGEKPGQGVFIMQSVANRAADEKKPDDLLGDWAFSRGDGSPICHITLMNTPGTRETYALRVKPGCDDGLIKLGLNSWRLGRTQLLLAPQRGDSWRFEESEGRWRRIPTRPDSLVLTRP